MRRHDFFSKSESVPEKYAQHQCRPTRGHVNDRAAGKIDCSNFRARIPHTIHPAVDPPNHVRDWEVDREHPHADENENGCEFHPLSDRADD